VNGTTKPTEKKTKKWRKKKVYVKD